MFANLDTPCNSNLTLWIESYSRMDKYPHSGAFVIRISAWSCHCVPAHEVVIIWDPIKMLIAKLAAFDVYYIWVVRVIYSQVNHSLWYPNRFFLESFYININHCRWEIDWNFPRSSLETFLKIKEIDKRPSQSFHATIVFLKLIKNIPVIFIACFS